MKLATLRTDSGTVAARLDGDVYRCLPPFTDVGCLLADPQWREIAAGLDGPEITASAADLAPVVADPGKVFCVGLNYASHIREMGRELPQFPTLFLKVAAALTGPRDRVTVPSALSGAMDWEGELAVIIGKSVRTDDLSIAGGAIAGFAVVNDFTLRDFQYRTLQWDQGKNLESSSGFGPWLVTPDEFTENAELRTEVNGTVVQEARIDDLVFGPAELITYISQLVTLNPGDVIITGTPGGVGHARRPPVYLSGGDTVEVFITGLGSVRNSVHVTD